MSGDDHDEDGEKTVFQAPGAAPPASPTEDTDSPDDVPEELAADVEPDMDEDRTVIRPGPAPTPSAAGEEEDERTVIAPAARPVASDDAAMDRTIIDPGAGISPPAPPPPSSAPPPQAEAAPKLLSGISIGQVLNHTYEVKRFIARGGMGEVFEGVNITNEQRVAIKVILPSLASDPNVIEMFVKEATVLERLIHPALVNYRTQARDPEAGVFYIVTNFIEGSSLETIIGKVQPTDAEIIGMARRLAEGLGAAHALGAIHRDIAPDNILLEGGDLDKAQIIDFGIARDIDPGSKTVIGTGFAGKLSFVAPEQLGAFEGDVGPWTDVYSLGLVLLGLAQGHTLKLGKSMFEAMEKRKDGVDTSAAPPGLRSLFDAMLTYDPAQRLRSMEDVVALLDRLSEGGDAGGTSLPGEERPSGLGAIPRPVLLGGGALLGVLLLAALGYIAFGGGDASNTAAVGGSTVAAADALDAGTAMQRAEAAISGVECNWIDLAVSGAPGALVLSANGVAGQPSMIESAVFTALQGGGVSTDFSGVEPILAVNCPGINALLPFRVKDSTALTQPQARSVLQRYPADYEVPGLAGQIGARHAIDIRLPDDTTIGLLTLKDGKVEAAAPVGTVLGLLGEGSRQGPGEFRVNTGTQTDTDIWTSFILIEGGGEIEAASQALIAGQFDRFGEVARANGLRVHMIWHHLVNEGVS